MRDSERKAALMHFDTDQARLTLEDVGQSHNYYVSQDSHAHLNVLVLFFTDLHNDLLSPTVRVNDIDTCLYTYKYTCTSTCSCMHMYMYIYIQYTCTCVRCRYDVILPNSSGVRVGGRGQRG